MEEGQGRGRKGDRLRSQKLKQSLKALDRILLKEGQAKRSRQKHGDQDATIETITVRSKLDKKG